MAGTLKPIWMARMFDEPALIADLFEDLTRRADHHKESSFAATRTGEAHTAVLELGRYEGIMELCDTIKRYEREDRDAMEQEQRKGGSGRG